MEEIRRLVVVGCSGCGAMAALTAKKRKPDLDVTIIREQEEKGLLTRCATPYICCGSVMVDPSYKDDRIFTGVGIKLVNVRAVGIDRDARRVMTADGSSHPYDKLVLATGAKPVIPPIPGADMPGVFTLRTSGDAVNILHWINARRVNKALLVGAGAIGVEEAYLLSRQGLNVSMVEMAGRVMPKSLDAEMSEVLATYMREQGLELKLGQQVVRIDGSDGVGQVALDSGERLEAGLVILSIGARANTKLAQRAGLTLGERGVQVDERLRTSDPDIYAGGDLIEYPCHITGKPTLGQLRPNAVIAGRTIARNLLGYHMRYPALINSFCTKSFEKSIGAAGITREQAEQEGIRVVEAKQESTSRHSMMRDQKPYVVKLLFNADTGAIIGGQILSDGDGTVRSIDVIALAIRCGLTASDLATFRAAGQPELSPDPGKEPIALAAGAALQSMEKQAV
jgi:NADH dehydrogenase/NADH oxidase (H2O2-forming)